MPYVENRVTVAEYGTLPTSSSLLVNVPTAQGHAQQRNHKVVAGYLVSMSAAVEVALGFPLTVASGWRPHRWASRAQYEQVLIERYGSVARGRIFLGFASPHETGLAVDLGCGGLAPVSATIAEQKETPLFKWLVEHMWEFGFTPYFAEPWHIEARISIVDYQSGIPDSESHAAPVCSPDDPDCIEAVGDNVSRSG